MRRTPIVLASTVAGMAAVLSFHPRPQGAGGRPRPAAVTAVAPRAPAPARSRAPARDRIAIGTDAANQYGDVQVRVRASGRRIVAVSATALPGGDSRSQAISAVAGPRLAQQALAAQSAGIDGVSGATYTSESYRRSLQSALDQLGAPPAKAGSPA